MADTDDDIDKTENLPQDPPSSTVVIDEIKGASEEAVTSEVTGSKVEVAVKISESKVDAEGENNVVIKLKEELSYIRGDGKGEDGVVEYESAEFEYMYDWQEDREDENKSGENYPERGVTLFYNKEDYVSGPIRVKRGTVPMNILEFQYPFEFFINRYVYKEYCTFLVNISRTLFLNESDSVILMPTIVGDILICALQMRTRLYLPQVI